MTTLDGVPPIPVQFYKTANYPCSYIPGYVARARVALPISEFSAERYTALVQQGFRRSGHFVYRPSCPHCQACVPVRVVVGAFQANRAQRRSWRKNQNLAVHFRSLQFDPEHFELYARYQKQRHSETNADTPMREQYEQFLLHTPVETLLVEFRQENRLYMVSFVDRVLDGWSAVYTFFEPDAADLGLGTFNVLWQIEQCRQRNLPYLYLGYWVAQSQKMAYKSRFQPLEVWQQDRWQPFA